MDIVYSDIDQELLSNLETVLELYDRRFYITIGQYKLSDMQAYRMLMEDDDRNKIISLIVDIKNAMIPPKYITVV